MCQWAINVPSVANVTDYMTNMIWSGHFDAYAILMHSGHLRPIFPARPCLNAGHNLHSSGPIPLKFNQAYIELCTGPGAGINESCSIRLALLLRLTWLFHEATTNAFTVCSISFTILAHFHSSRSFSHSLGLSHSISVSLVLSFSFNFIRSHPISFSLVPSNIASGSVATCEQAKMANEIIQIYLFHEWVMNTSMH